MTTAALARRITWHEAVARMFARHGWPATARQFGKLADVYRKELAARQETTAAMVTTRKCGEWLPYKDA
jgi:hypothetical protein